MNLSSKFTVSVAPMMDWTDRHCRFFHRQLTLHTRLYTEMVVSDAVIHGDREYLLGFHDIEHPVALQIGGSDPKKLREASKIGADFGYDEINLNIGCPSDRVQAGRFGACLMQEPDLVAECYTAMQSAVDVPVTIKCRLGVDAQEIENTLPEFLEKVSRAGCTHFIIHARKAWLKGLSPKENRDVPPLNYELVRQMKVRFPQLEIILNGGVKTISDARAETAELDGVMLGRAAYQDPWILTEVDSEFYGSSTPVPTRDAVVDALIAYTRSIESQDRSTKAIIRHIMGLYAGLPGARLWRRTLSETGATGVLPSQIIETAALAMRQFQNAA